MTGSLTASVGNAQSVAVREESATATRPVLITISAQQAPLAKVLRDIAAQASLAVALSAKVIQSPTRVTVNVHEMPLNRVLATVLEGTVIKATVAAGTIVFAESESVMTASVTQGTIIGTVVDAKTKQGLRGASVILMGTNRGATSSDDGHFRIAAIAPGSYTLQVRMVGYVKAQRTIVVQDEQTASVEIVLEPSVNALDQVVVTGTVIPTAQYAIPNAMTVITAADIEQRGITRIDQLFRGDVPGLFSQNIGSGTSLDQVTMYARGGTSLTAGATTPIKTYVDGVELADPRYLSQIDPGSIERIEIVTGPQASTIYGSNAINGVMQIFTKRGHRAGRPQLTASLLTGFVENNYRSTFTPQHDYTVRVNGVESAASYNVGGSWLYLGPWSPSAQSSRWGGFGGLRIQRGPVSGDASLRYSITQNRARGSADQTLSANRETGLYAPTYSNGRQPPLLRALNGQTLGLTIGYTPTSWWSHEVVIGYDHANTESRRTAPGNVQPADTAFQLSQGNNSRTSLRYASTAQLPLTSGITSVVSVGAESWKNLVTSLSVQAPVLTGTLSGTPTVIRQPGHNTGGFLQARLGMHDALFVTYGLRAEWNPNYGDDAQPNLAPRYGVTYTRDIVTPRGVATVKVRSSYGKATRPPEAGFKNAQNAIDFLGMVPASMLLIPWYGNIDIFLANPDLGPEFQRGWEYGAEVYMGNRGSLVVTLYDQVVDGLIARVDGVDSARSLLPNLPPTGSSRDAEGYGYYPQGRILNVGSIRNRGWEVQGSINAGPLTTRGTYSWTRSRVIGIDARYRALLSGSQYQHGASLQYLPEHTWALGTTYAAARTSMSLNLTGTGMLRNQNNALTTGELSSSNRLQIRQWRVVAPTSGYFAMNRGYVLAALSANHRISSRLEGVLQIVNLTDTYRNDYSAVYATLGRQTKFGARLRW